MTDEEAIEALTDEDVVNPYLTLEALEIAIDALKERAERKTGKWIFGETLGHSWMKCSECCVSQSGQTLTFTYCPNCGVKMEGDDADELQMHP